MTKNKTVRMSTLALHRTTSKKGNEGFEDLRNFVKTGADFCKDIVSILQERAELESAYAKGVSKLAGKLFKASKENSGTVANAWHFVANDFEQTAEIHKTVAAAVLEELAKPLKVFVENQHKTRKTSEAVVEKRSKQLVDWRTTEAKAKAKCYLSCRENEKCQDQMLDCKLGRGRQLSDKEQVKLENKRKKSEGTVRKSDMEYYGSSIKAERSRLDYEGSVQRGCYVLRRLEEERLEQLKGVVQQFHRVMGENRPKLVSLSQRLEEPVSLCNVNKDIQELKVDVDIEGMGDQMLPNFYCEDVMNVMNKERRREALVKFLAIVKADIDRERKGRAGVENLAKALQETPKFGGEESQADVQDKLQHMRSMLTYLEATRFKVLNAMMDLEGRPRVNHPLSAYIDNQKDKQGMSQSYLRIPSWARHDAQPPTPDHMDLVNNLPEWDRGTADGGTGDWSPVSHNGRSPPLPILTTVVSGDSREDSPVFTTTNHLIADIDGFGIDEEEDDDDIGSPDYRGPADGLATPDDTPDSDFDDFDSNEEEVDDKTINSQDNEIHEIYYQEKQVAVIGQCRAIYDYTANMYDELSIRYGDVINIHDKQEDGWWLGECEGSVGIFPATYVEPL